MSSFVTLDSEEFSCISSEVSKNLKDVFAIFGLFGDMHWACLYSASVLAKLQGCPC